MTYQKLFDLKYRRGISTHDLIRRFPEKAHKVSEVALLEIPEHTLKEIIATEDEFQRLMRLKRRLERYLQEK